MVCSLGLPLGVSGCGRVSDVSKAHAQGRGSTVSYAVSADRAWEVAQDILKKAGAGKIEEHRDQGYMLTTTKGGGGISFGTHVGVWIEPGEAGQTKVTAVTKQKLSAAKGPLTEGSFHNQFAQALADPGAPTAPSETAVAAGSSSAGTSPAAAAKPPGSAAKASATKAPAAAAKATGDALAGYAVVNTTSYGKALTAERPGTASVRDGLSAALRDLTRYFANRPTLRGAYEDQRDHRSGAAVFTALHEKKPVKGIVFCKLEAKGAKIGVVYARADTPPKEWNKLVAGPPPSGDQKKSAQGKAKSASAAPLPAAAHVPLTTYRFPDGTGTVGLAQGWRTTAQTAMQGFAINGPGDARVAIGIAYSVYAPPGPGLPTALVGPLVGPADALRGLAPQLSRLNMQQGGPALAIDGITVRAAAKAGIPGGRAATLSYNVTESGKGPQKHYRALATIETAPNGQGLWMMFVNEVRAPDARFDRDLPVMLQIATSFRENAAVINQTSQQNLRASNESFEAYQQAQREKSAAFDQQIADNEAASRNRARQVDDFN